jgi:hypothetical protein
MPATSWSAARTASATSSRRVRSRTAAGHGWSRCAAWCARGRDRLAPVTPASRIAGRSKGAPSVGLLPCPMRAHQTQVFRAAFAAGPYRLPAQCRGWQPMSLQPATGTTNGAQTPPDWTRPRRPGPCTAPGSWTRLSGQLPTLHGNSNHALRRRSERVELHQAPTCSELTSSGSSPFRQS